MGFEGRRDNFRSGFRRNNGPRRSFDGPREMHKITCSECGKESEVPFKPRGDRPLFCKDCYMKKNGIEPRNGGRNFRDESGESESGEHDSCEAGDIVQTDGSDF